MSQSFIYKNSYQFVCFNYHYNLSIYTYICIVDGLDWVSDIEIMRGYAVSSEEHNISKSNMESKFI